MGRGFVKGFLRKNRGVSEIRVLEQGFVRLVDQMGDDSRVVQAARVSYGAGTKTQREDAALIDYLMRHQHTSPFEMVEFLFHVKTPIFVARQWFRHRTASVNEVSGRYSVMEEQMYMPTGLRAQSQSNRQRGEGNLAPGDEDAGKGEIEMAYKESYEHYQDLIARGVAREQARLVLPLGIYTEFYWKQDLHNLFHFLKLRLAQEAQEEIRVYAEAIAQIVSERVPVCWQAFNEHILKAASLSDSELSALRALLDPEAYRAALASQGLSGSRLREALAKLF